MGFERELIENTARRSQARNKTQYSLRDIKSGHFDVEHGLHLGDLYTESGQTLQSSFSAVSKPIFATKYSLESSRRDLQNALLCTALESQFFSKILPKF